MLTARLAAQRRAAVPCFAYAQMKMMQRSFEDYPAASQPASQPPDSRLSSYYAGRSFWFDPKDHVFTSHWCISDAHCCHMLDFDWL